MSLVALLLRVGLLCLCTRHLVTDMDYRHLLMVHVNQRRYVVYRLSPSAFCPISAHFQGIFSQAFPGHKDAQWTR